MDKIIKRTIVSETLHVISFTNNLTRFSYAENISEKLFPDKKNEILLEIYIKNNHYFESLMIKHKNDLKFSDCVYIKREGKNKFNIIYTKKLYQLGKLWMHIIEEPKKIRVFINPFYFNIFKFHIESIVPFGEHLKNLTYLSLLNSGYLSLHAASFAINKSCGILIMGPPHIGKSTTVSNAIKDGGYFLSENIAVTDQKNIFNVPYTSTSYHKDNKIMSLIILPYLKKTNPPMGIIFRKKLLSKAQLKYICVLEKSNKNEIKEIKNSEKDKLLDKIMLLNQNEFRYVFDEIIMSKFYYYDKISEIKKKEKLLFKKFLISKKVFLVSSKTPEDFYKLIKMKLY